MPGASDSNDSSTISGSVTNSVILGNEGHHSVMIVENVMKERSLVVVRDEILDLLGTLFRGEVF
ncbi:MAG: hypothetical protein CL862_12740 [Cyanobium sp. NAT70]|nr:hypothetical protein [Cyanobium sp. NAT70]